MKLIPLALILTVLPLRSQAGVWENQAAMLRSQRAWILAAIHDGSFNRQPGLCVDFVRSLGQMKATALETAAALGDDASAVASVPLLGESVCK
jgi:hypothetical protein